jgi:hypothetical protein
MSGKRVKLTDVEVTNEVLAELGYPPVNLSLSRSRRHRFVKGPISLAWLHQVDVAAHTVALALTIKALVDTVRDEPVSIPPEVWRQWGLTRESRRRAFDALERAGIIRTERPRGRAVQIWLLVKPD